LDGNFNLGDTFRNIIHPVHKIIDYGSFDIDHGIFIELTGLTTPHEGAIESRIVAEFKPIEHNRCQAEKGQGDQEHEAFEIGISKHHRIILLTINHNHTLRLAN
jgi:hypothetical protein